MHLRYHFRVAAVVLAAMTAASPIYASAAEPAQSQEIVIEAGETDESSTETEAGTENPGKEPETESAGSMESAVQTGKGEEEDPNPETEQASAGQEEQNQSEQESAAELPQEADNNDMTDSQ